MKIYMCIHCGNIAIKVVDSGVNMVCCGEDMIELKCNTIDASIEKHIPVIIKNNDKYEIRVGSVNHPMSEEHNIRFLVIVTNKGYDVKYLEVNQEPAIEYTTSDEIKEVYAYCNIHGLWKKEID